MFLASNDGQGFEYLRPPPDVQGSLGEALRVRRAWYSALRALGLPQEDADEPACGFSLCVSGKAPNRMCAGCRIIRCTNRIRWSS